MGSSDTSTARWAILGAGGISRDFAAGLRHAQRGRLHAVGARDAAAARAFADEHGADIAGTYDEVIARDDIDAVYIGTVHTTHAELAIAALEAGKGVLCEKPLTATPADTDAVLDVAARTGMPLLEAFKYRFGPFPTALAELIAGGALGAVQRVDAELGFAAAERTGRLFDPAVAGGAILDVGCYPVSLAVGVAAWAGAPVEQAAVVDATGVIGPTGVDETATASLRIGGVDAHVHTSIVEPTPRAARITGDEAVLEIPNAWGSRTASTDTATLRRADGSVETLTFGTVEPMAAEADAVILALLEGRTEVPEMPWVQTRAVARLLADWRAGLG
ncbi:Gfo/Idh/MocA family protein [Microbacterium sp. bgisy189]|uniref:Gfo/Idh/MocA family protein n=1 Tax=Microbacterium sp. bgisy189 TaxID=3413798 RepID=UPI003EBFD24E